MGTATELEDDELTLQVDSVVTDEESPEKHRATRVVDGDLNSWSAPPMTESTALARSEPGAEPYRVRPVDEAAMGFWWEGGDDGFEGNM